MVAIWKVNSGCWTQQPNPINRSQWIVTNNGWKWSMIMADTKGQHGITARKQQPVAPRRLTQMKWRREQALQQMEKLAKIEWGPSKCGRSWFLKDFWLPNSLLVLTQKADPKDGSLEMLRWKLRFSGRSQHTRLLCNSYNNSVTCHHYQQQHVFFIITVIIMIIIESSLEGAVVPHHRFNVLKLLKNWTSSDTKQD